MRHSLTLGHHGVLFLDEVCEFSRSHLEALRQPLEAREVSVARSRGAVMFPADFVLVAAANPCPCGHLGDEAGCTCTLRALGEYSSRLSGPIRDRIDLVINVPRQHYSDLFDRSAGELSATVRERITMARALQTRRNPVSHRRGTHNAALDGKELQDTAGPTSAATRLLGLAGERLRLSARGFFRVLRVARTIADLTWRSRGWRGGRRRGAALPRRGATIVTAGAGAVRLCRGAPGWPDRLEHLETPPAELWVRGALPPSSTPCVAVVGSRRAAPGALLTARDIALDLAAAGIIVISGMARGVDAAAHHGALLGNGITVAVLGCGIEVCYPAEHRHLRERIEAAGCVISEDGGAEPPLGWRFPRRNRLIAALAEAVVVVEATARSGALSTARWAADLGREVLAVPGSIRSPSSVGTNLLIRDGVRPFLGVTDLFEAAPQLRRAMTAEPAVRALPDGGEPLLAEGDSVLSLVLDQLGADPVHPDDLAATLGLGMATLAPALTTLQLRGAITDVCGGRVARTF